MNNNLKCPFCNGELVGTIGHPICRNQNCVVCDDPMPQDLLEELIRMRKAFNVAVEALKTVRRYTAINQFAPKSREAHIVAKKALAEITALEQKE